MSDKRQFLKVPRIIQSNSTSCMAAALASIYAFYEKDRSEAEIWKQRKKPRPETEEEFILSADIIADAYENGFDSSCFQIDLDKEFKFSEIRDIFRNYKNEGVPVFVVHQFTKEKSKMGHARIVTDVSNTSIYLTGPDPNIDGENQRWDWNKFIEMWRKTSEEVLGGVFIIIKPKKD